MEEFNFLGELTLSAKHGQVKVYEPFLVPFSFFFLFTGKPLYDYIVCIIWLFILPS